MMGGTESLRERHDYTEGIGQIQCSPQAGRNERSQTAEGRGNSPSPGLRDRRRLSRTLPTNGRESYQV
jgi:hypothetical protein